MIPSFSVSGVLPPFLGGDPTVPAGQAPFRVTIDEVVDRFSFSLERIAILEGFLHYREQMRTLNVDGYQWLDGSFVEDCEGIRGRPPGDIDIVTFAYRPVDQQGAILDSHAFLALSNQRPDLFDPDDAKQTYRCDAYYVDLNQKPHALAASVTYWCNLFSHTRVNSLWKGMLQVMLNVDDSNARAILYAKKQALLTANQGVSNA
ncbi:DUF6932 family protein [Kosakonia cowanii]|uniref:DUF6932 family protein n=1 Tax=Kosakonia cowanii TaxID=208223 RepID=UPI0028A059CD|nr:hypothetical protein [Kosakonia cowanii]